MNKETLKTLLKQMAQVGICIAVLVLIAVACEQNHEIKEVKAQLTYDDVRINALEVKAEQIAEEPEEHDGINYRETIRQAAKEWGLDPLKAVAISRLETGNWTSRAFTEGYNYGGISRKGKPIFYADDTEGIMAYMVTLDNYRGMTIDEMAEKYCPPNAKQWAKSVKELMEEER